MTRSPAAQADALSAVTDTLITQTAARLSDAADAREARAHSGRRQAARADRRAARRAARAALTLTALTVTGAALYEAPAAVSAVMSHTPAQVSYDSRAHVRLTLSRAAHTPARQGGSFITGADISAAHVSGVITVTP